MTSFRYHISDWMSFDPNPCTRSYKMEKDQELSMVEGALQFLTMLLHVRTYLGKFLFGKKQQTKCFLCPSVRLKISIL